jgi:cytochrome c oxidase assembly protein subunit 15
MTIAKPNHSHSLAIWLFSCCVLIAALVVIGAITRLTESGLSIVDWHAASDMLPPLSNTAWGEAFQKYQTSPQYKDVNAGMSLADFKAIYFWEWLHRLLGRLVGLAYALPLAVFWLRGKIPAALKPRFVFYLFLGGLQGAIGWYMVKSGLVNEPRVSHYRLALHLCTALLLLSLLWLQALQLSPRVRMLAHNYSTIHLEKYRAHGFAALGIICVTILWGAFVAGLRAGMEYNEFPTMGGHLIPGEILFLQPWWQNFLSNHASVQFLHRVLGTLSFLTVFSFGLRCFWSRNYLLKNCGIVLMLAITLQFILGISTLLSRVAIPLATLHQSGAVLTLLTILSTLSFLTYRR